MKIATWNVNSIRARLERLLAWLEWAQPDVVALQEVKTTEEQFPYDAIARAGYTAVVSGQKTYNGVAILAREPISEVERGFSGDDDPQARLIAATVSGVRIVSIYIPNGASVGTESYSYKLRWLEGLKSYLKCYDLTSQPLVVCGDMNIAPEERDVARPDRWEGTVLFNPELRKQFSEILALGLVDVVRQHHTEAGLYSWWDYRQLSFPRNDGLRIDHILAGHPLAERCTAAGIDRDMRKGTQPSDHVPVWATFELDKGAATR